MSSKSPRSSLLPLRTFLNVQWQTGPEPHAPDILYIIQSCVCVHACVHTCVCVWAHTCLHVHTLRFPSEHVASIPAITLTACWVPGILEPLISNNGSRWRYPNEMSSFGAPLGSPHNAHSVHREIVGDSKGATNSYRSYLPFKHYCPKSDLFVGHRLSQQMDLNLIRSLAMWSWARHSASVSVSVKWI